MNRLELESKYKRLLGIDDGQNVPSIVKLSDVDLAKKITTMEDALNRTKSARAQGDIEGLRSRQAAVLGSQSTVEQWLRRSFTMWEASRDSTAFAPFSAAVELYQQPSTGVAAIYERLEGRNREIFREAVSAFIAYCILNRDPDTVFKVELGNLAREIGCAAEVIILLDDNAYLALGWMRVDAWPFQASQAKKIFTSYLRSSARVSAIRAVYDIFKDFHMFAKYYREGILREKDVDELRTVLDLRFDPDDLRGAFGSRQMKDRWQLKLAGPHLPIEVPRDLASHRPIGHAVGPALSLAFKARAESPAETRVVTI